MWSTFLTECCEDHIHSLTMVAAMFSLRSSLLSISSAPPQLQDFCSWPQFCTPVEFNRENSRPWCCKKFEAAARGKGFGELLQRRRRAENPNEEAENPNEEAEKTEVCPCGGGELRKEYDACCGVFHEGEIEPDAVTVMKARFSAYARGVVEYVVRTTHKENPDYRGAEKLAADVKATCARLRFTKLEVLDTETTSENEVSVSFRVTYSLAKKSRTWDQKFLLEKSRFVRDDVGRWLYIQGTPLSQASQAAWVASSSS